MRIPLSVLSLAAVALASPATAQTFDSSGGRLSIETVARGLDNPWALAFLPDGRMLVTERPGRMRIVSRDGTLSAPVGGVPPVYASGQGGLLDVVLDRDYATNRTIHFCYAEPADGSSRTALASATLIADGAPRLDNVRVVFRQQPAGSRGYHYGCRIAQPADGTLWLTTGDYFSQMRQAQTLDNHLGKVIRIRLDGSVPPDNPFVGRPGAMPEIWSYGHRNPQGMTVHPVTGIVWMNEHGPRGGDEINIPRKGLNYGWPAIGYGVDYSGARIHEATAKDGMEQPLWHWTPSIAPSGMAFYTGDLLPAWRGSLFVGSLNRAVLIRLEVDGEKVVREERLLETLGDNIRDVRQGPDGALWLLTQSAQGRVLRLAPGR